MQAIQKRQTNGSGKISSTADCIRKWLVKLAALYNRELSAPLFAIWIESLGDLSLAVLESAFLKISQTFVPTSACPFPTPAHIRQVLAPANQAAANLEADEAWQKALAWIGRWYSPDMPGATYRGAPKLPERVLYALGKAGGFYSLWDCAAEFLPLRQKDFCAAYADYVRLEQDRNFLPPARAKELLGELRKELRS